MAQPERPQSRPKRRLSLFTIWLIGLAIFGVIAFVAVVLLYAVQVSGNNTWMVFTVAVLTGGAASAIGALLGFLFGIPRVLQSDQLTKKEKYRVLANSNLEQISDWLTKIIVGVGLVQLGTIPDQLGRLGAALAPGFGGTPSSSVFAVGLVLTCVISWFLLSYMWTRTAFLGILQKAAKRFRSGKAISADAQATENYGHTARVANDQSES